MNAPSDLSRSSPRSSRAASPPKNGRPGSISRRPTGWSPSSAGTTSSSPISRRKIPGTEHFLINPYGLMFDEITASSLVKIDISGKVLQDTPFPINPAGFVIHSAVHSARHDAGA